MSVENVLVDGAGVPGRLPDPDEADVEEPEPPPESQAFNNEPSVAMSSRAVPLRS